MADGSGTLDGGLHPTRMTLDADSFGEAVLWSDPTGEQRGGGKDRAGGFTIPIGSLAGLQEGEFQNLKWKVYERGLKPAILVKMGAKANSE
jgi:hypothetical protein